MLFKPKLIVLFSAATLIAAPILTCIRQLPTPGSPVDADSAEYGVRSSTATAPSGGGTAFGWSGYAVNGGPFSVVAGSWTIPAVSFVNYPGSTPNTEFSSTWVGIGGNASSDGTLIQLGTAQNVSPTGEVKYYPWFLLVQGVAVPATPIPLPVSPGDRITASLQCVANCTPNTQQTWRLSMTNSTKGWTWPQTPQTFQYTSSMASAEWIMEDPIVQSADALPNLPKYGSVAFTGVTANGANPKLSLLTEGITMISSNGLPISIPTAATGGNSFVVNQVGLPPALAPTQPTLGNCTSGQDYGELASGSTHSAQGTLPKGQSMFYRFYLTHYSLMQTSAFVPLPPKYSIGFVDDQTEAVLQAPLFPQSISLDPGYYCLKVYGAQNPPSVPFNLQIGPLLDGYQPGTTASLAVNLSILDIGDLTPNGYLGPKWRYLYPPNSNPPPDLMQDHVYVVRDWVGTNVPNAYYRLKLDNQSNISINFSNLYLAARATVETESGQVVAETAESPGSPLTPRPLSQQFNGSLPAGIYDLHVAFAGIGSPGTPYQLTLSAH